MLGDYHSKHVEFVKFSILHFSDCLLGVFSPSAGVIEFYMSVENIVPWKILFFGRYCFFFNGGGPRLTTVDIFF